MRTLCALVLLSGVARADTTPPTTTPPPPQRETPKPGSTEWRSITAVIAAYCARQPSYICRDIVSDLRKNPSSVSFYWHAEDVLDVDSRFDPHGFERVRLRRSRNAWRVLSVDEAWIPHTPPKFD